ncbi:MAG: hypothetical protein KatS3mg044_0692 [Rhodothermaceae bacterium]|nr:MAG: hypothetical protein KatS3mg044_0692 [Rhodothermaceae bacterium]
MKEFTRDEEPLGPGSEAGERPLYVFFGHHKCATGWIDSILRETCFHLGWRFRIVHRPLDFARYGSLRGFVKRHRPDMLAYTNANLRYVRGLPPFRGFHVVRDPRDVVVSAYFSHLYSHPTDNWPELAAHRRRLQAVSKEEGLMMELAFSRQFLEDMATWDYEQPNVLELKLEDISVRPEAMFWQIYSFLGLIDPAEPDLVARVRMQLNVLNQRGRRFTPFHMPLSPFRFPMERLPAPYVERIVQRKSFKRLAGGRKPGEENVRSHYRKGQPGDWRNHFGPEHIAYFREHYQGLLEKLGYETDDAWAEELLSS